MTERLACVRDTVAPAPTSTSLNVVSGPMTAPLSTLVAPVHIGDGVYVAAGSTVTSDVGPGELAVARGLQRNIPGWVARKKAGSKTAAAAEAAQAAMQQEGAE